MRVLTCTRFGIAIASVLLVGAAAAAATTTQYTVGPITNVSAQCNGQNAEVEQATDPKLGYVYETWMGCNGIAFARSTDDGLSFSKPISVPGSIGSNLNTWDPAVAVAPDGTVYAVLMIAKGAQWYPIVATSFDHGVTFTQTASLIPPDAKNWGDRDFIAVGPDGTVYVTWDYGPERSSVTDICATNGSCAFATGDLNVVIQKSTDRGRTFGPMSYISPGFPASGGDSAPLVVEPNARIDVLYQGYHITDPVTFTMEPAYQYFTSSTDQGSTWSPPVRVGEQGGTMSLAEWWIDGAIGTDAGGNLYATWDTQGENADGSANDVGWLAYSTDHGARWSAPIQAPRDPADAPHIMEVVGGASGTAYVGWLSGADARGYAAYLRTFSIKSGWLSDALQLSAEFGNTSVWPGDTIGLSTLTPSDVVVSWGSATPSTGNKQSQIFATHLRAQFH
jgi:hypothetical protein